MKPEYLTCSDCKKLKKMCDVEVCPKCNHYYKDGEICSCIGDD